MGDNVIANVLGDAGKHNIDEGTSTNANIWTLNMVKGATDMMTATLWAPPLEGSTVPVSPSGPPTENLVVSLPCILGN